MVAWRYEISLLMLKNISPVKHSKINFVSPRGHVISSIYFVINNEFAFSRSNYDLVHKVFISFLEVYIVSS